VSIAGQAGARDDLAVVLIGAARGPHIPMKRVVDVVDVPITLVLVTLVLVALVLVVVIVLLVVVVTQPTSVLQLLHALQHPWYSPEAGPVAVQLPFRNVHWEFRQACWQRLSAVGSPSQRLSHWE